MLVLLAVAWIRSPRSRQSRATLNNLGPDWARLPITSAVVDTVSKWAMVCAMLLGRLEIFTLLVLIHADVLAALSQWRSLTNLEAMLAVAMTARCCASRSE